MKTLITATLAIAFIFSAQSTAKADRHDRAIVGGIIGGIIVGSILDNDHHHTQTRVSYSSHRNHHQCGSHCSNYKRVSQRNWVPGYWSVTFDNCGQRRKSYIRGHYEVSYRKVWVGCSYRSDSRNNRYDRDNHQRNDHRYRNDYRNNDRNHNDRHQRNDKPQPRYSHSNR